MKQLYTIVSKNLFKKNISDQAVRKAYSIIGWSNRWKIIMKNLSIRLQKKHLWSFRYDCTPDLFVMYLRYQKYSICTRFVINKVLMTIW